MIKYRREIDGLRALAVIPVIFFHAGFEFFSGGYVGVDVFFVISGYLITSILISDLAAGKFSVIGFYDRRARRILPALFCVMLASIPFAWMWLSPADMKDFTQSVVAVSLFSSNFLFWQEIGYFETAAELKPLLHTWSLAVEEQFYVFFPLLLLLLWRFGRTVLIAVLVIIGIVSLALAHWGSTHSPSATFFLLHTRAWELMIGAWIAFYHASPAHKAVTAVPFSARRLAWYQALSMTGLVMIACACLAFDESTPFPSLYALLPTVGTGLVILFAQPGTWAERILGSRILVGIGLISYSAYLWHQPLFAFARHATLAQPSTSVYLVLIAATFILAYATWRFVENPFRNRQLISRRKIFALASAFSVATISFGVAGNVTTGFFKTRVTAHQQQVLATVAASPMRNKCHMYEGSYIEPENACEYMGGRIDTAVVGDSHAVEIAYAIAEVLAPYGRGVKHFSASGCPPIYGRPDPALPCSQWIHEVVDYIIHNPDIKHVVVSYRIHSALFGAHEKTYPELPNKVSDKDRAAVWSSYVGMMNAFKAAGKNVVLVLQAPEISAPVSALIMQRYGLRADLGGVERSWWNARSAYVRSRLRRFKGVAVVDPADYFCDSTTCYAVRDNHALYFDDDHMSLWGAQIVARTVYGRIKNQAEPTVPMVRNFSRRN